LVGCDFVVALADRADVETLDRIGEDGDEEEGEPGCGFDEIPRFFIVAALTRYSVYWPVIPGCLVSPAEDYEGAPPFCAFERMLVMCQEREAPDLLVVYGKAMALGGACQDAVGSEKPTEREVRLRDTC